LYKFRQPEMSDVVRTDRQTDRHENERSVTESADTCWALYIPTLRATNYNLSHSPRQKRLVAEQGNRDERTDVSVPGDHNLPGYLLNECGEHWTLLLDRFLWRKAELQNEEHCDERGRLRGRRVVAHIILTGVDD